MPCIVLTGGPGAGKTALIEHLSGIGQPTVEESARAIIAERLARGLSPRPAPLEFARAILDRDLEKYQRHCGAAHRVFFDRSAIEAIGMLHEASPLPPSELQALLDRYPFHPLVFVLPPWQDIYTTDSERDQSFEQAVAVHDRVVRWYTACGYRLHEVPHHPAAQRAAHVLQVLDAHPAQSRALNTASPPPH
ncbi:MAG: AAA family ATPase [Hydrogenophaga sp.]|uniref:AAA family ATPase n=1 Tax=Hydrogenophaga sp. TaxID=1904254 RepID=UPI0016A9B1BB|nr:AAA family ATPase [Hydrogenophaga sp.]NIM41940.1 AAA family ATPase [Hydrogenophaga sp.]NIN27243.1 AAA family ATPase [Hydrogenophaga sp.]NIN31944.1 AAA family ATPase [Hydrogenophaga sp.]NIN56337.1 AAA family ATPase [Hydrogenophaga sp.]NIO52317.1 AAA family ATPase [Hydrogenophaga sp.]